MTFDDIKTILKNMSQEKKDAYKQEFINQDLKYVCPFPGCTLEELEYQWNEFNQMTKPFRRKSDWIHLEYLGIANEEIYNIFKNHLISSPINNDDLAYPDNQDSEVSEEYGDTLLMTESEFIPAADNVNADVALSNINIDKSFELAEQWCKETGFVMILPCANVNEIDERWEAFNMMTHKHRRVSDWKCLELFGLTNLQMYKYWRGLMLKSDGIDKVTPDSFIDGESLSVDHVPFSETAFLRNYFKKVMVHESAAELGRALNSIITKGKTYDNLYQSIIMKGVIEDTLTNYQAQNSLNIQINYSDMPMFTPDEMIDMGIFGHEPVENYFNAIGDDIISGDDTVLEWFKQYRQIYNGLPISEAFNKINLNRIRTLDNIYKTTTIEQRINNPALCQHILEMGWNPIYEFDPVTRVKADKRINNLIEAGFGASKIIDLRGFRTINLSKFAINEKSNVVNDGNYLKPIYLIFEEGTALFSKAIKAYTHGIYSHAAIAFDSTLEKMYSYGIEGSEKGAIGGFIIENIKDKNKDCHMGVYTIFVNNDIWQTIYDNVMHFVENVKQTAYSYANILTLIFKIPMEKSNNMICSQFVDRMLKLGGIDVTGKSSSLVDPNYLHRVSKASKTIYKMFEGKVKNFKPKQLYDRTYGMLNKISKYKTGIQFESNLYNESVFYYDSLNALNEISEMDLFEKYKALPLKSIYETLYMPCMEAKEIPIRFDKNGDILIDPFRLDYKSEYAKSHKLLMAYEKSKNYEGMKSELAKLWMMNISIEKKVQKSKFNKSRIKYLQDSKALILNDFKKYLDIVLQQEKDFDFEKYFIESPYYDQTYRVGKDTIKNTINLIKTVL